MHEIDVEVFVDSPVHQGEAFMEYVDHHLYDKYEGNLSPALRAGEPYISATLEAEGEQLSDAILPLLHDLEAIGLRIRSFEVVRITALA